MAMWGGRGAQVRLTVGDSPAVALFGESPSRLIVEVAPRHVPAFILLARQHGLPGDELGFTGGARLVIELAGEGATGAAEERGSRIADALDVPIDGPAPRLGARPATGARVGGARHVIANGADA